MSAGQFALLATRRFLPLFITQFLSALNDNIFKNAFIILVTFRLAAADGIDGRLLATIAAGVFILPFFMLSATAGRLADRFEKSRLVVAIKLAEIGIMALAAVAFSSSSIVLLMTVLLLMGAHSTFFGPLKYGILPVHLKSTELLSGNALVEAGTFLAILLGTVAGGVLVLVHEGPALVSILCLSVAILGFAASLFIPRAAPAAPGLKIGLNIAAHTWEMMRDAARRRDVFFTILGISWFWLLGATYLSQFPYFAKDVLGADNQAVTLMLTAFSVGIGVGSLLCNRLLKGEISARYVPLGAVGMTIFTVDLYWTASGFPPLQGPRPLAAFLADPAAWRVLADLSLIAVCGGLYIVPLYAILQDRSDPVRRSRIIAANNIINALAIVSGTVAAVGLLAAGLTIPQLFLVLGLLNLAVALVVCRLLPGVVVKGLIASVLRLAYKVEIRGIEHATEGAERAVIVANHVSFLDAALIAAFLPGRLTFAINSLVARRWWVRPAAWFFDIFPIDPTNPLATKLLIRAVQDGRRCVIFPEGRITVTGALMKVYEGPGMIADKAGAAILPVRIDGAQYSTFSRLRGKVRLRWFPKITLTVLPPRRLAVDATQSGRRRRQAIGLQLYDLMSEMVFETCDYRRALFDALLEARTIHGGNRPIIEDVRRQPLTYNGLVTGSIVLGRRLARITGPGERVGVLLPNATAGAVTFFALQAYGRVPALLNFSTGAAAMETACGIATLKTVVTSRQFLAAAKLEDAVERLGEQVRIAHLEDVRAGIGVIEKLLGFIDSIRLRFYRWRAPEPSQPAVVLFTSGSEGSPKGVVLSHENILANRYQLGAIVDFNSTDIVFNPLPIFHAFGLTGGLLLPLLAGVKTFLYPSPLHYRIVPQLVYDTNATILFGTDTFLTGYARAAHSYDFYSVRYVFAGAERVREETRRLWSERFGLRILEGYGTTETAPVIAVNTPMQYRPGSVGRFVPGTRHRLDPVPGLEEGGRLIVTGPNVMLGYLRAERPGEMEPTGEQTYDTGDIVSVDALGFVTIHGRAKRFAKIAGEMVSLSAVETAAASLWPNSQVVVVAVPHSRKGEELVLVTDNPVAEREALARHARAAGLPELFVPRRILRVEHIPLLGTGKVDYPALTGLVMASADSKAEAGVDSVSDGETSDISARPKVAQSPMIRTR